MSLHSSSHSDAGHAPNALPSAYPTWPTLVLSALHPQLLILYAYFTLIVFLLHRVVFRSIFAERVPSKGRGLEAATWSALAVLSLGSTWT